MATFNFTSLVTFSPPPSLPKRRSFTPLKVQGEGENTQVPQPPLQVECKSTQPPILPSTTSYIAVEKYWRYKSQASPDDRDVEFLESWMKDNVKNIFTKKGMLDEVMDIHSLYVSLKFKELKIPFFESVEELLLLTTGPYDIEPFENSKLNEHALLRVLERRMLDMKCKKVDFPNNLRVYKDFLLDGLHDHHYALKNMVYMSTKQTEKQKAIVELYNVKCLYLSTLFRNRVDVMFGGEEPRAYIDSVGEEIDEAMCYDSWIYGVLSSHSYDQFIASGIAPLVQRKEKTENNKKKPGGKK